MGKERDLTKQEIKEYNRKKIKIKSKAEQLLQKTV